MVKNLPANETWVWSLGGGDPLEEGMVTHSSILAWRIPGTEKPGGLQRVEKSRMWLSTAQLAFVPSNFNFLCLLSFHTVHGILSWFSSLPLWSFVSVALASFSSGSVLGPLFYFFQWFHLIPQLHLYFCVCMLSRFSHIQFFVTPWTVAHQASLSMGFSRQEY